MTEPERLYTGETRGVSSVGRAPALQAGGRRFEPGTLHLFASAIPRERNPAARIPRLRRGTSLKRAAPRPGGPFSSWAGRSPLPCHRGALAPRLSEIFSSRDAVLRERYAALVADDAEARPAVPRTRSLVADERRKLRAYVEEHGQGDIVGLATNAAYQISERSDTERRNLRAESDNIRGGGTSERAISTRTTRPGSPPSHSRRRSASAPEPAPSSRGSATPSPSSSTCSLERHETTQRG